MNINFGIEHLVDCDKVFLMEHKLNNNLIHLLVAVIKVGVEIVDEAIVGVTMEE